MLRLRSALLLPLVRFSLLALAIPIGGSLAAAGQAQRSTARRTGAMGRHLGHFGL